MHRLPNSAVGATALALALAGCQATQPPELSPGRQWHVAYNGYGHVFARARGVAVQLTLQPARPSTQVSTHAALVLSASRWGDFTAEIRVRTNAQLRHPRPNAWEVGWLLWHYVNDQHFYYIILKPNGWELGKEDPSYPGNQRFLATGTNPAFPPGRWYEIRVQQRGAVIHVDVDGRRLVEFADTQRPYLAGQIGFYAEDASATFQPIDVSEGP